MKPQKALWPIKYNTVFDQMGLAIKILIFLSILRPTENQGFVRVPGNDAQEKALKL